MSRPGPETAREPARPDGQPVSEMVAAHGVSRTFGSGHTAVQALREVSFTVRRGQLVAVCGRSGSGKTTLLNIIGGLDTPTGGHLEVAGREVTRMPERDRLALRRSTVAFIFQSFGLIPMLSAAENVGVPLRITGTPPQAREERVATMLSIVGLSEHAEHRPDELSGGQQQRVAIARALAGRPELLIADEPTSQLDLETGRQIMRLLLTVVRSEGITALVATHDEALIDLADSVLRLEDGHVQAAAPPPERHPRRDEHGGRPEQRIQRGQVPGLRRERRPEHQHHPRTAQPHGGQPRQGLGQQRKRDGQRDKHHRGRQIRAAEPGVTNQLVGGGK